MAKDDNFILEDSKKLMISDEIIIQAIQDLYRDEIRESIKEKLKANPRLESELKEAIKDYLRGKLLEAGAQGKMLKVVAELGLISLPESFRDEMVKSILKAIGPELDTLMKNTL
jgi:type I site-specific restriction-modification system R (restriction) subunit